MEEKRKERNSKKQKAKNAQIIYGTQGAEHYASLEHSSIPDLCGDTLTSPRDVTLTKGRSWRDNEKHVEPQHNITHKVTRLL
jgi:hypothetical protein